ncbi:MAG TPA: 50S ribosomal protein L24 [Thermoleophilia bacterium]|nr:50S ribosomal protein L24 [Thermoleophilia bacterium]HQG02866.1 50S ribosomal protein L24 [Thermoleophilia bacterium]HQJ97916.1 50S ribosomal protein L24 [Thermoleophilia bacterium]
MSKLKIHKGDQVKILSGKEAGKTGKVLRVDVEKGRVYVERLNMLKRHTKPNPKKNPQGGVIEREGPLDASNVMVVCPACGQPTRVGYRILEDGGKVRVCRRANCGKDIDKA